MGWIDVFQLLMAGILITVGFREARRRQWIDLTFTTVLVGWNFFSAVADVGLIR